MHLPVAPEGVGVAEGAGVWFAGVVEGRVWVGVLGIEILPFTYFKYAAIQLVDIAP